MGIQGLMKLISEEAPLAVKEMDMEELTGRRIAIDASMAMYQFLIAVRSSGPGGAGQAMQLTNEAGEVTSHVQGMFNRTIKMMSCGVSPVYVFDGKPPQMKGGELAKRMAKRSKAEADLAEAKEAGDAEGVDKYSSRLVKVSRQHNEDCKQLLRLMGVPVVDAPCEAEAQCAELAVKGKVYATATEDMDALTFRTPKLLRKMTFAPSGDKKHTVVELDFAAVLSGMALTYEEFVDLCILCGCDYCSTIRGIGPKTALKLIREFSTIERVIRYLAKDKKKKYAVPADWKEVRVPIRSASDIESKEDVGDEEQTKENSENDALPLSDAAVAGEGEGEGEDEEAVVEDDLDLGAEEEEEEEAEVGTAEVEVVEGVEGVDFEVVPPMYVQARRLFTHADVSVADDVELRWTDPDEAGLKDFLVTKMGFNESRVENGITKLKAAQKKKTQRRVDSFFAVVAPTAAEADAKKRKADAARVAQQQSKKGKTSAAAKTGGFGKKK